VRSEAEVEEVQALAASGLNHCQIARRTAIPRSTVRDWLSGKKPNHSRVGSLEPPDLSLLLQAEYAYLLGLYLGDGCISLGPRNVFKLRIFLDSRYRNIIMECAAAMRAVMPMNVVYVQDVRVSNMVEVHCHSKAWTHLFPQHGPGRKHQRKIALVEWQQEIVDRHPKELIRGLIHSDGCRVINKSMGHEYIRYFFTQVSDDIRQIFCGTCDQLGIGWRQPKWNTISIARAPDVALLDEFVGPKA